jgi:hypothetical protein
MPRTPDELADWIVATARDPARLEAEAAKLQPTPFTTALSNCIHVDEKIMLFARCFDVEALPAWIRLNRWDQARLREAAGDLDRLGQGDLAALVREVIPTIKAKVSASIEAKRKAARESKRAYRKALAKARRKP